MDQFVSISHKFIDSDLYKKVDGNWFKTYFLLKRHVWRDIKKNETLGKYYQEGLIVAYIGQNKMAEMLGVTPRSIKSWIKKLKDLGWIKIQKDPRFLGNLYILGECKVIQEKDKLKPEEKYFIDKDV